MIKNKSIRPFNTTSGNCSFALQIENTGIAFPSTAVPIPVFGLAHSRNWGYRTIMREYKMEPISFFQGDATSLTFIFAEVGAPGPGNNFYKYNFTKENFNYFSYAQKAEFVPFVITSIKLYSQDINTSIFSLITSIDTFETVADKLVMEKYPVKTYFDPNQAKFRGNNNPYLEIPCQFVVDGQNGLVLNLNDNPPVGKLINLEFKGNFCKSPREN